MSSAHDDLGNRDATIDLRVGSEDYVVDANNNRYSEIAQNSLSYNKAGDLTTDKNGYKYEYDYENRIVRIKDSADANVAEYAYDALGRRIEKVDSKTSANSRRYYHGKQWSRRAGKTDTSNNEKAWFIYGNYIDEVLRITNKTGTNNGNYY